MRVIAGLYKGRNIRTVNDLSVRPATDRVRQTLFDTLATRVELRLGLAHLVDLEGIYPKQADILPAND